MVQSMISSGYTKSLAQNSLSMGYHTCTPCSDSVITCVTAGHCCNAIGTCSIGIVPANQTGLHTLRGRTVISGAGNKDECTHHP